MKIINKDITTIESGIIVHQVNCQGVMGSGVAKAIRDKWSQVFGLYKEYIQHTKYCYQTLKKYWNTVELLGSIQTVRINENIIIINLFGQDYYGIDGKRYTSYGAWEEALPTIKKYCNLETLPVYFPYNIGCDRGGGDWRIISAMIEEYFPDAIFCKI